jgi:hypothetical protein
MKLWIRVDAASPRDPKIGNLASALGIHRSQALGLAVAVWCAMSEHAVDGNIARVSDATLEEWAGWPGRRGRFAPEFRSMFTDADGTVSGWSERQGALLTRMERDRQRHKKEAPKPPPSPEPPRKVQGNSAEHLRSLHGKSTSTERNGTERKELSASSGAGAPANNWVAAATDIIAAIGTFPHGRVGKALLPVVQRYGWEETEKGLRDYVAAPKNGRSKTPEYFAQESGTWVVGAREDFADADGVPTARADRLFGVAS